MWTRLTCMKKREVLKRIEKAAKRAGVDFEVTEASRHTQIVVGTVKTTISRHPEVAEGTAEALYRQLQPALGKGWWRK